MTLPYFEVHEGNGPYLLMLHGILSSRAQWRPNLDALKKVCSPVIVELYGHGRSPAPLDNALYTPEAYIEAFESIRLSLQVNQWMVLGYSLGAGLTLRYALNHPEQILAGAFTNSTSALAKKDTRREFTDNPQAIIDRYESGGLAELEKIPVHPKYAKRIPEPTISELLADCEKLNPGGLARTIVYTNGYASMREELRNVKVPHLLLCGEREERFIEFRDFATTKMDNLQVINLNAGHAVNIEAANDFNTAICQFITAYTA